MLKRFLKDSSGATAIEYGLIVGVLSLAIVAGVQSVGDAIVWLFSSTQSALVQAFQ